MSKSKPVSVRTVFSDPVHILAFGFGSGLAPVAPGTFGSLVGVLLAWLTVDLDLMLRIGIALGTVLLGIWICGASSRKLGVHDHGGIVWDEISGMYITLLVAPVSLMGWAAAFVLFRAFDIVKPWPISDLDHRLGGGLGIMLDDLVAALYAALLLAFYGWFMT
ncbi:MAG: phosphatidylglycerophosphatase A [Pseudomonadota bacterium]